MLEYAEPPSPTAAVLSLVVPLSSTAVPALVSGAADNDDGDAEDIG